MDVEEAEGGGNDHNVDVQEDFIGPRSDKFRCVEENDCKTNGSGQPRIHELSIKRCFETSPSTLALHCGDHGTQRMSDPLQDSQSS